MGGFTFSKLAGGTDPIVKVDAGETGLQFPNNGLRIKLPVPSTQVVLRLGQFSHPFSIYLKATNGTTVVPPVVFNKPNGYATKAFKLKRKVAVIELRGGNNEGVVVRVCSII